MEPTQTPKEDRLLSLKQVSQLFCEKTGISHGSFYNHHRNKIPFSQITPKTFLIYQSQFDAYLKKVLEETAKTIKNS